MIVLQEFSNNFILISKMEVMTDYLSLSLKHFGHFSQATAFLCFIFFVCIVLFVCVLLFLLAFSFLFGDAFFFVCVFFFLFGDVFFFICVFIFCLVMCSFLFAFSFLFVLALLGHRILRLCLQFIGSSVPGDVSNQSTLSFDDFKKNKEEERRSKYKKANAHAKQPVHPRKAHQMV